MAHLRSILLFINSSCIAIVADQRKLALLLAWFRINVRYCRVLLFEFAVAGKFATIHPLNKQRFEPLHLNTAIIESCLLSQQVQICLSSRSL